MISNQATMKNKKILIAEISGKRPGTSAARPTEKFNYDFDKVIISNNADGYTTDWKIVLVPEDYQKWYKENIAISSKAFYAPMNRSYAIKYAREHGYDYLIQLDDNIVSFAICFCTKDQSGVFRTLKTTKNIKNVQNDMFKYLVDVMENTNAVMGGMTLTGASLPNHMWLSERYVYSAFILDLKKCPDYFQGDFEDDIEYRLKITQMGLPTVQVVPFQYSKTSQGSGKKEDLSGNRKAYSDVGLDRGKHMSILYGDIYSRGWSSRGSGVARKNGKKAFRHKIKPIKVGLLIKNKKYLSFEMKKIFDKYTTFVSNKIKYTQK